MSSYSLIVAERIKQRRQTLDLSQRDLAEKSGIPQSRISRYEKSEAEPTASALVAIAEVLETTPDWLVGYIPLEGVDTDLSDEEKELLNLYRTKPIERQKNLVEIVRLF